MDSAKTFACRVIAPLSLMGLIFFLSAQPHLGTDLGLIDLIGRKIAHAGVYGVLTLLWLWALLPLIAGSWSRPSKALLFAASISFLYAISDEYHQTFVEGRSGSALDVAIDAVGILIASWLVASGRLVGLATAVRNACRTTS